LPQDNARGIQRDFLPATTSGRLSACRFVPVRVIKDGDQPKTSTKKCTTYSSLHHLSSSCEFKLKYRTARNNTAREEQHQHKIPADGKPAKMTKAKFAMSLQLNAQRELKITMTGECH
jgi:hypothetical protein